MDSCSATDHLRPTIGQPKSRNAHTIIVILLTEELAG